VPPPASEEKWVSVEDSALIASVVFVGLFSGLYGMLNFILHRVMGAMNGPEFARFLRRFLRVARKSPFNYVVVIGMVLAPAVALIATEDAGSPRFLLTAIGLALTLGGNAVVSNRIAEPNYDRMLAWDPGQMPADWEAGRCYYFKLNWIRAVSTWTAFAVLLAALVEPL
jgi:hypothetical protein